MATLAEKGLPFWSWLGKCVKFIQTFFASVFKKMSTSLNFIIRRCSMTSQKVLSMDADCTKFVLKICQPFFPVLKYFFFFLHHFEMYCPASIFTLCINDSGILAFYGATKNIESQIFYLKKSASDALLVPPGAGGV